MFRTIMLSAATVMVGLCLSPSGVSADDWDDYRERVEEWREAQHERYEEQRERYEDWLEDQEEAREEAREEYRERYEDYRRSYRFGHRGLPPAYYPETQYYGPWGPSYGPWYGPAPWRFDEDDDSGGIYFRGPRGRGFGFNW